VAVVLKTLDREQEDLAEEELEQLQEPQQLELQIKAEEAEDLDILQMSVVQVVQE
jgi:hypothetical protein